MASYYASSDDDRSRGGSPVRRQNLFSDSDDDDRGGGRISEAEEDNSLNRREGGASGQVSGGGSDDEAEEERKKAAKKKKDERKKPKGPVRRQMISEDLLTGKNGLSKLPEIFKDFKFGGKGRERKDLDSILSKLEHWVHLLHPKQPFDQSLQRIEFLGGKRKVIKTHLKRIRMGMVNNYEENDLVVDEEDDAMNNINAEELAESASAFTRLANNLESQVPTTSASMFPSMTTQVNNENDFPDEDDDFFENIDENTIVNAKAVVNDLEEMDMDDIPQDDDDNDDIFMKQMEDQMKRAEMAETQNLEKQKQSVDVMEIEPVKDKHSDEKEQPESTSLDPEPVASSLEPTISSMEPTTSSLEPTISSLEPTISSLEPTISSLEPTISSLEPTTSSLEPVTSSMEPTTSSLEPVTSSMEPVITAESEELTPIKPTENSQVDKDDTTILVNDMTTIIVSGVTSNMEKTSAVDDDDDGIMLDELRDNDDDDN